MHFARRSLIALAAAGCALTAQAQGQPTLVVGLMLPATGTFAM